MSQNENGVYGKKKHLLQFNDYFIVETIILVITMSLYL